MLTSSENDDAVLATGTGQLTGSSDGLGTTNPDCMLAEIFLYLMQLRSRAFRQRRDMALSALYLDLSHASSVRREISMEDGQRRKVPELCAPGGRAGGADHPGVEISVNWTAIGVWG